MSLPGPESPSDPLSLPPTDAFGEDALEQLARVIPFAGRLPFSLGYIEQDDGTNERMLLIDKMRGTEQGPFNGKRTIFD